MRPTLQTLSAAGISPLVPVAYNAQAPQVSVAVTLSNGASLTYTVWLTFDDTSQDVNGANVRSVAISQTTNTITVTDYGPALSPNLSSGHQLSVGDAVQLTNCPNANQNGWYLVASVTSSAVYTVTSAVSQSVSGSAYCASYRLFSISWFGLTALVGATARGYAEFPYSITGLMLNVTSYTSGTAQMIVEQSMGS